ncbi:hypothetical protein [Prescottella agglutinans]|uniref:Uncharacterized protein n=1 Tax=Prescottella agglutinans TaxID=1644129 RepID=A0ABT6M5C6_9NOCA|nr:hypothetical protein [Prescottella agglutinans]MDH6279503.1 hypothetical protein [Prescottella agglutinans]
MLVCDCGTTDRRHDYGCGGWRRPTTRDGIRATARRAVANPGPYTGPLDLDPWGWAARGITNPDKETQR